MSELLDAPSSLSTSSTHVVQNSYIKDINIAGLLCVFLGALGIHRLYLGRYLSGVLCFLFCWTGLPWILAAWDGLMMFVITQAQWDTRYNPGLNTTLQQSPSIHWFVKILVILPALGFAFSVVWLLGMLLVMLGVASYIIR